MSGSAFLLQLSETTALFSPVVRQPHHGVPMAGFIHRPIGAPRSRLRAWQQARTWARLIREAEALWHVDVRALHRIAELELSQLLDEVPPVQRSQVNRWLARYDVATRFRGENQEI